MRRNKRRGTRLTDAERAELRRRIAVGETFVRAAAAVGCSRKTIQRLLASDAAVIPPIKRRAALRLSLAEREEGSR